jgi:YD repeat-containing protein
MVKGALLRTRGRLYQVKEQAETNATNTTTTYTYDVGNRLSRVQQATTAGTQNRWFTYDNRGFLSSEQHPGFALRMLRLPVPKERQITIGVDQAAGTRFRDRRPSSGRRCDRCDDLRVPPGLPGRSPSSKCVGGRFRSYPRQRYKIGDPSLGTGRLPGLFDLAR